ncbi:hypothetical protein CRUP_001739, partial [Coryphaenoides rupestris]
MTVPVKSASILDLTEGFSKLDTFCKGSNVEGKSVCTKNWPALITITQGEEDGSQSVSVSWFFPPGTELPTPRDASMSKEVRPAGLVYVSLPESSSSGEEEPLVLPLLEELLSGDRAEDPGNPESSRASEESVAFCTSFTSFTSST